MPSLRPAREGPGPAHGDVSGLPRFWIAMQILIVIFVAAGMIIAIVRLATE